MQVNPRQQHQRKHNGERQGDGKRHHRPGAHTKRHETHRHDDQDRLPKAFGEIANGDIHSLRLIGHQEGLDPDWQAAFNLAHFEAQILAKRQNIPAFAHRHRKTNGGLAINAEHGLRRVRESAADFSNIGQPHQPITGKEGHCRKISLILESAGNAQRQPFLPCLHQPRRAHCILRLKGRDKCGVIQPKPGQTFQREFNENHLILRAQDFDFRDIRHTEQP